MQKTRAAQHQTTAQSNQLPSRSKLFEWIEIMSNYVSRRLSGPISIRNNSAVGQFLLIWLPFGLMCQPMLCVVKDLSEAKLTPELPGATFPTF